MQWRGAALDARSEAYYPSAHPSPVDRPGGPNTGELAGRATPAGGRAMFADGAPDGCVATLTLVVSTSAREDRLVVEDNG